ncbi:hypothetical protein [Clostridium estertheticum]|uniref:hypothetical protein n=1 Tax=Clostridium estertheticum TaxID=238834 RepID=UPI001C0D0363|nr:hypothetical protein [Clostridium estertheticum]MBU3173253.1 hypothetical protein [Clostridium estertheticum]
MINEELAKRSKENYSFTEYKVGSATEEYNKVILQATEKIEKAKIKISQEGKNKLEKLLSSYKINYANWINKHNANGARHVSVMIAGPSNYDMKGHRKWEARENKLWEDFKNIEDITDSINKIIGGDKIIKSSDVNAIEKLKEKLEMAKIEHKEYKDYNVKARKEGKEKLASYVLSNSNGRMKGIKDRITRLEKLAEKETSEVDPSIETEINGIKIIDNVESNRLQILFNCKPGVEVRTKLKKHGFRWSPSNGAWQRFRGIEAVRIAKEIVLNC